VLISEKNCIEKNVTMQELATFDFGFEGSKVND